MILPPEILDSGEVAWPIPIIADSRGEQRFTSVFLATVSAAPSFAPALLAPLGRRFGQGSIINTYTEAVLQAYDNTKDRSDGLLQISSGGRVWAALIEAKIGNTVLAAEQAQRYLQLACSKQRDAVITISHQYVGRPEHSPVAIPRILTKSVELYH